jgi:hypothetical protein
MDQRRRFQVLLYVSSVVLPELREVVTDVRRMEVSGNILPYASLRIREQHFMNKCNRSGRTFNIE